MTEYYNEPKLFGLPPNCNIPEDTIHIRKYKLVAFNLPEESGNIAQHAEQEWIGSFLSDLFVENDPWNHHIPPMKATSHHTLLFQTPVNLETPPEPKETPNALHWDDDHVKMPFSTKNLYEEDDGNRISIKSRWELIKTSLERPITSSFELEEALHAYTQHPKKLVRLHYFFHTVLYQDESDYFFNFLLPEIIKLALKLPELIHSPIPLLHKDKEHAVSLSQLQISSLMANAFLCTYPRPKSSSYPKLNFITLYDYENDLNDVEKTNFVNEKLRCLLNYFHRVCTRPPTGVVTFARKYIPEGKLPKWEKNKTTLENTKLHITSTGNIQDDGLGMLQVDFSHPFIGGLVLSDGCAEEEIMFVNSPELIVSRLFTEQIGDTEALLIIGAERFNKCSGALREFKWIGDFEDTTPVDTFGRRKTTIIAVDPLPKPDEQFKVTKIVRELNKMYVGFHEEKKAKEHLSAIATGKWGCGEFGGDVQLKSLLQIMVCAAVGRNIVYYTFGDKEARDEIHEIHQFLIENNLSIGHIFKLLSCYEDEENQQIPLYAFIHNTILKSLNSSQKSDDNISQNSESKDENESLDSETKTKKCVIQ